MKVLSILAAVALILAGCASATLLTPTQSDVDRMSGMYPGYTLAELNEGKSIFEQNCQSCHGLKDPVSRTAEEWKEIVPVMVPKANKKNDNAITPEAQDKLLKYLITMSTQK